MRRSLLIIMLIGLISIELVAADIPSGVYEASREAHHYWLGIEKNITDESNNKKCMPSLSSLEESVYRPFPYYSISCEDMQNCKSGDDLVAHLKIYCYRAPLIFENQIEGFATIKFGMDPLKNEKGWHHTSFGPGAEKETEYYSLLQKYPEDSGNEIFPFFLEYGSRGFFLIKTNENTYRIMPFSETAKLFLDTYSQEYFGYEIRPLEMVLQGLIRRAIECSQIQRY